MDRDGEDADVGVGGGSDEVVCDGGRRVAGLVVGGGVGGVCTSYTAYLEYIDHLGSPTLPENREGENSDSGRSPY